MTAAPWQTPTRANRHRPEVLVEQLPERTVVVPPRTRLTYPITAMGKPRATQRDKWNPSKAVQRYRLFKDEVRLYGIELPEHGYKLTFVLPMPKSWPKKKRAAMDGSPHQQKPDKDNLEKALLDAVFEDDSRVWQGEVVKLWGETGAIIIETEVQ